MAAYVHVSFLSNYAVLSRVKGEDEVLALDISSVEPLFVNAFYSFRVISAYSTNTMDHRVHSVQLGVRFLDHGLPLLVVGDLKINNPLSDQLLFFSSREISFSTPYFAKAAEAGFALVNPVGEL